MRVETINSFNVAQAASYPTMEDDGEKAFESLLLQKNLRLYKLKEGSSVYNALADQVYAQEEYSERVESECYSYWQKHLNRFGPIPSTFGSLEHYHNLFSIAAQVYGRMIVIYRIDGGNYCFKDYRNN